MRRVLSVAAAIALLATMLVGGSLTTGGGEAAALEGVIVRWDSNSRPFGGNGGRAVGPFNCPGGQVITGFRFREATGVDSLDGIELAGRCSTVSLSGTNLTFTPAAEMTALNGANTGGTTETVDCPAGMALVGVDANTTPFPVLDWLRLRCAPFTYNASTGRLVRGAITEVSNTLGLVDNMAGSTFYDNVDCGPNLVLGGYSGRVGSALDQVRFECNALLAGNLTIRVVVDSGSRVPADFTVNVTDAAGNVVPFTDGQQKIMTPSNYTLTLVPVANYRLVSIDCGAGVQTAPLVLADADIRTCIVHVATTATDLQVTKTGPASVVAGEQATWTIGVTNAGPVTATGVTLTDTLPSEFTVVSMSSPGLTCNTSTLTCTNASLAVGQSMTVTLTATARVDVADGTTVTNRASATADQGELTPGDNNDAVDITVNRRADLAIAKTAGPTATAGGLGTFTLRATNNGPSTASSVTVTDTLDSRFTFEPASSDAACTATGQTVTCTAATLAPGASVSFALGVRVASDVADGVSIDNTATVSAAETDPDRSNNTSTASLTVVRAADLRVVKSAVTPTVTAGNAGTWSMTVTNTGLSDASSATLTDTLPTAFLGTGVQATVTSGAAANCQVVGRVVTCTWATLPRSATSTIEVRGTIDPAASAGGVDNTARVTATETDPDTSNNSSTATLTVDRSAGLTITKTGASATVVAGNRFVWTVAVTNNGPSTATGTTMSDTLPAGLTLVGATTDLGVCTGTTTVNCTLGTLAVGRTATITITTAVASSVAAGTVITNTATAQAAEAAAVTAGASVNVERRIDLAVVKSASAPRVPAGRSVTWNVNVTNNGPSDASDVDVSDTIPAGFTVTSTTGGTCSGSSTLVCRVPTLPAGATATLTISGTIAADTQPGTMRNAVSVAANEPDTDTSNNATTATLEVYRLSDLSVLKADAVDPVRIGTAVAYSLRVTNAGPSYAAEVRVVDTLPSPLVFDAATSDARCSAAGSVVTCTVAGELAVGASVTVMIGARVPSGADAATVTNNASASSNSEDPDGATDSETTTLVEAAGLRAAKSVDRTRLDAGEALTWTITIDNDGPTDAREVTLTDTIPADVTLGSVTTSAGTCSSAATVTCALGTIVAGGRVTVTLSATTDTDYVPADADSRTLINTAQVASSTRGSDPCAQDTCTVTTVVEPSAEVSILKSVVTNPAVAGRTMTWNIRVANAGPSMARDLVVTDALDGRLTFVAPVAGDSATSDTRCRAAGRTITCDVGDLDVGTTDLRIVTMIDASATGTIPNTASVVNPVGPTCSASCESGATATVTVLADLEVTGSPALALPLGASGTATFTARNLGPSVATGATLVVTLPKGLDLTAVPRGSGYSCGSPSVGADGVTTVTCTVPSLAVGASLSLPFPVVASAVVAASIGAVGTLPAGMETVTSNNAATVPVTVRAGADGLTITKTGTLGPDRSIRWRIVVTNNGPEVVPPGAVVEDTLPSGLVVASVNADANLSCASSVGGSSVRCPSASRLTPGSSWIIDLDTVADGTLDGAEVRNTASVSALGVTRSAVATVTQPQPTRVLGLTVSRTAVAPAADVVAPVLAYTGSTIGLVLVLGVSLLFVGLLVARRRRLGRR